MKRILGTILALAGPAIFLLAGRHAIAQVSVPFSQGAIPSTTLGAAIAGGSSGNATTIIVASNTGLIAGQYLLVDQEAMQMVTIPTTPTTNTPISVRRGQFGTTANSHPNSATVYYGPGYQFQSTDPPIGSCGSSTTSFLPSSSPWINAKTGTVWQCTASVWMNVVDAYQFVAPSSCSYATSGGTLTAQTGVGVSSNIGLGLIGATTTQPTSIYQIATTNAGTATNTLQCVIPVPSRTNLTRGSYLMDDTFYYGVQQTGLGTQVAVLASGTMNGVLVFQQIALPTAGAAETASTVAPTRADAGTLLITPVVASSNVATTTAGAFYSVKFTPATPIALTSDGTAYYVAATFLATATSATTLNTPGHIVHYRMLSEGRVVR